MHLSVRLILLGQLVLYSGLATCILILPSGLNSNDGISYYGVHAQTVIPYAIALIGAAIFGWLAAHTLQGAELRFARQSIIIYGFLILSIVLTPYGTTRLLSDVHSIVSVALFSLQVVLSCWLAMRLMTWWSWMLVSTAIGAGLLSILFLSPTHGFLLQAQLVFQLAFGGLIAAGLQVLLSRGTIKPTIATERIV